MASTSGVVAPPQTKDSEPEIGERPASPALKRNLGCSLNPDTDLARGRKLASSSRWQEALIAYDPAVRKRPGDATLRAERGFALYKLGAIAQAESDWLLGLGLTKDQGTLGALHFNLGLLYETKHMPDESSLHFALAESLGNRAAGRRLGAASRCRARWIRNPPEEPPAPLAFSLRELLGARQLAGCPEIAGAATEKGAAKWLCRSCSYGAWADDDRCALKFPLDVADGSMSFALFNFFAEKLPGTKPLYLYFRDHEEVWTKRRIEAGLLILDRPRDVEADLNDGLGSTLYATPEVAYTYTVDNASAVDATRQTCEPEYDGAAVGPAGMAGPSPSSGNWSYPVTTRKMRTSVLYSVTTRAPLLRIESHGGDVAVSVEGNSLKLTGLGCNETIELSAPSPTPASVQPVLHPGNEHEPRDTHSANRRE